MPARWIVNREEFKANAKQLVTQDPTFAVVKNNAYNYGLEFSVLSFLEVGINHFATTSLEEAINIRKIASNAIIFLMNPCTNFDKLRKYNIQMTLPSLSFLEQYKSELEEIPIHIEFEGLLHRSGLTSINEFLKVIQMGDKLNIKGIWTHFAYADEFDVDEYYLERKQWVDLVEQLMQSGYHFSYIHAQNSASYLREGELLPYHTHSRMGIALYGSKPYESISNQMITQSLELSATVLQVRKLEKGDYSGYSFTYLAKQNNTRLAVVDIGYGDGMLSSRAQYHCKIKNTNYPIVGLMMSHLLVEVDDKVEAGDEVLIYSNHDDLRVDYFTARGVGANSQQLSSLNHDSLIKEYQ